ncbi:MAG: hypothetical protein PVF15_00375 [Candidatus Bathyarchaeota archaeon]
MANEKLEAKADSPKAVATEKEAPWKGGFELASMGIAVFIIVLLALSFLPAEVGENASDLLNSNIMITLIGAVVAPWIAKTAKDKVGLEITSSEVQDLLDGMKRAAELTRKEYDKKRENGALPGEKPKDAKEHAIKHIRNMLGEEKYNKIMKKVGDQFLSKAIDEYVASEWHERFPIEKEHVTDLVTVAVDMIPKVKDWNSLSNDERKKITDEAFKNLEKLLDGAGIFGWGRNMLEAFVMAELNKRPQNSTIS